MEGVVFQNVVTGGIDFLRAAGSTKVDAFLQKLLRLLSALNSNVGFLPIRYFLQDQAGCAMLGGKHREISHCDRSFEKILSYLSDEIKKS